MSYKLDDEFAQVAGPLLQHLAATTTPPLVHDIESRRKNLSGLFALAASKITNPADTEQTKHQIKTRDGGSIDLVQVSKKGGGTKGPGILYLHGGGMIAVSAAEYLPFVSLYVHHTGVPFFVPDYRLAPERKDEDLIHDCYDALEWLRSGAEKFGIDKKRIAVMGDSAGGGLAAGIALRARDQGISPPLAKQILIYPMLDDRNLEANASLVPFATWTYDDNITAWTALLGDKAGKADATISPYCAPIRATSLKGLPSTYMDCGELDIFIDEDKEYAERLQRAGVEVEVGLYSGLPHAWELFGGQETSKGKQISAARMAFISSF